MNRGRPVSIALNTSPLSTDSSNGGKLSYENFCLEKVRLRSSVNFFQKEIKNFSYFSYRSNLSNPRYSMKIIFLDCLKSSSRNIFDTSKNSGFFLSRRNFKKSSIKLFPKMNQGFEYFNSFRSNLSNPVLSLLSQLWEKIIIKSCEEIYNFFRKVKVKVSITSIFQFISINSNLLKETRHKKSAGEKICCRLPKIIYLRVASLSRRKESNDQSRRAIRPPFIRPVTGLDRSTILVSAETLCTLSTGQTASIPLSIPLVFLLRLNTSKYHDGQKWLLLLLLHKLCEIVF